MSQASQEKISKLPKWAQDHILDLSRERDLAVNSLKEWADSQTESPFSITELVCTSTPPDIYTRFVQGYKMNIKHAGMDVDVLLRDSTIEISYATAARAIGNVNLQPSSFQQVRLFIASHEGTEGQS